MTTKENGTRREGSLEAPERHALDWQSPDFYDESKLFTELERVFDICHGCRRCFNLCHAFPALFDAIDEGDTGELESVAKEVYWDVVDHCYLCDMCFMTKCPYVPPHEWNVDFPHLMLRAKAVKYKKGMTSTRDSILASTDSVGRLAGIPVIVNAVNAVNQSSAGRKMLQKTLGIHPDAHLPKYNARKARQRIKPDASSAPRATDATTGKVALFATCYGNYNEPEICEDLAAVFRHNGIQLELVDKEQCCGMPKLELGDLDAVARAKEVNVPALARMVDAGFDLVAPVPSCVLMFKQELPLMFPGDAEVQKVRDAMFDPFEYLMLRHKAGLLKTDFSKSLGTVAYHVACHLRVQNIGLKTRDILSLIPDSQVQAIERCSGHDGTYAVKQEFHEISMKIGRAVFDRVKQSEPAYYSSDCPMAGHQIATGLGDENGPKHPMTLLRMAYGI